MLQPLPHCVYVLLSEYDLKFYIGYTTNLQRRIQEHNSGKNKSTADRIPLELIFCEFYLNRKDALRRERYLKSTEGKRVLRLMIRDYLREALK